MAFGIHLSDAAGLSHDIPHQQSQLGIEGAHEASFNQTRAGLQHVPGAFPEDSPPPSPALSTRSSLDVADHPAGGSVHEAPELTGQGSTHLPSATFDLDNIDVPPQATGDGIQSASDADDRLEHAGAMEEGAVLQAAGGNTQAVPEAGHHPEQVAATEGSTAQQGRVTRWANRNYKFGDTLDKALKPYTVPLTAAGVTAGLGLGIYNITKK